MDIAIVNGQELPFTPAEAYLFDRMMSIFINHQISLENRIISLEKYRGMTIINDDTIDRFQENLRQDLDQDVLGGEVIEGFIGDGSQ